MRAAIYARFSSDNQREESITAQVRACTEYAHRQKYTIVKTYTDEAKSATTDDRPGFLRMIQDGKAGLFDVLIIHKLDRFSRNRYDSAFYKRELHIAGIQIESVVEHLDDSPESVILESVLEGLAEYYSKNLGREVMKGMTETALQGKHTGGKPPLGYDVDPETKKLIINKAEARAVKLIFELYIQDISYNKIIQALNKKGYTTKRGNPFGKNSLYEILKNKKYCGIYTFNRSSKKTANGKRNHHASKDTNEIIEIPGGVPAIVDQETFQKAQAILKKRKQEPAAKYKAKAEYLLSGKMFCAECGKRMVGDSSSYSLRNGEKKKLHYYLCNNARRTGTCSNGKIRKEVIEEFVMGELEKQLFNEKTIPILAEKLHQLYLERHKENSSETRQIEKEIAEVDKQATNLVDILADGAGAQIQFIVEKLKVLEQKKTLLSTELAEAENKSQLKLKKEHIENFLQFNMQRLKQKNPETAKQLVGEFVEKVIVGEQVEVTFTLTVDMDGGGGGI